MKHQHFDFSTNFDDAFPNEKLRKNVVRKFIVQLSVAQNRQEWIVAPTKECHKNATIQTSTFVIQRWHEERPMRWKLNMMEVLNSELQFIFNNSTFSVSQHGVSSAKCDAAMTIFMHMQ